MHPSAEMACSHFVTENVLPYLMVDCDRAAANEAGLAGQLKDWLAGFPGEVTLVADHPYDIFLVARACPGLSLLAKLAIAPNMNGLDRSLWRGKEIRHHALHDARVLARELAFGGVSCTSTERGRAQGPANAIEQGANR